jgi:integrase
MGAVLDHVERDPKTGRLIYRRVYPLALRPFIPPPNVQLKRSLAAKTLDAPGAMERFRDVAAQYGATVALALKASTGSFDLLTPELVTFLITAYKAEQLGVDEEVRWLDRPLAIKTRASLRVRKDLEQDLADCRALRAMGDIAGITAAWGDAANGYAESHLFRLDRSAPAFTQYCRAFNDINIDVWEAMEQRLNGHQVPTPPPPVAPAEIRPEAPHQLSSGDTFEDIAVAILDSPRQAISPTTRQGAQTALRFLREALGPATPAALTRRAVTDWLDLMAKRPAKVPRAQRAATLPELAALYADRPDVVRLSSVTLDRHVGALGTLWRKAVTAGTIEEDLPNPFKDRASPVGPRRRRGPKGFSMAEMQAVFALPVFTKGERPLRGRGEASYWLPLMLLWTGARPEEIAQMVVTDIVEDPSSGRWLMTITDEGHHPVKGQQSLKTTKKDSGVRTFPVPEPLIDLGLLDYHAWLAASGETALFPKLTIKNARRLLFPTFGEWWSIYTRVHGAVPAGDGRQPAREFRHSFTTAARASGIPRDALEYLMGHRAAGATANEGYGEKQALGLAIGLLRYAGLDLTGVRRWTVPSA